MRSLRSSFRAMAALSVLVFLAAAAAAGLSLRRWAQGEARSSLARDLAFGTVTLAMIVAEEPSGGGPRTQWEAASAGMRAALESFGSGLAAEGGAPASIGQAVRLLAWADELHALMDGAEGAGARAAYREALSAVMLHLASRIRLINSEWAVESRKAAVLRASLGFSGGNLLLVLFILLSGLGARSLALVPLGRIAEDIGRYAGDPSARARLSGVRELDLVAAAFNRAAEEAAALAASLAAEIAERAKAQEALGLRLGEKEVLLRETHHRIKNNLASVSALLELQAMGHGEGAAAAALREAAGRVAGMRNLYERMLLSDQYGELEAGPYVAELLELAVRSAEGACAVGVRAVCDGLRLDAKTLSPLGIALNELATNSLKYAFRGRSEGRIEAELRAEGDWICLRLRDDGIGLPTGFDPSAGSGFGLSLVAMLAEQLKGGFAIGPGPGGIGTEAVLRFPRAVAPAASRPAAG